MFSVGAFVIAVDSSIRFLTGFPDHKRTASSADEFARKDVILSGLETMWVSSIILHLLLHFVKKLFVDDWRNAVVLHVALGVFSDVFPVAEHVIE